MIYSQHDPKWGKIQLGTGPTTIDQEGCFITCLAMICGKTPDEVNTILRDNGGYVNGKVSWYPASKLLGLTPVIILAAYSNDLVLRYLKDGKNVLVIVNGAPIGGAMHMVRYMGNQRCIDPWDGTEKSTSAYPQPMSIVVFEPTEDIKQDPADLTWPERDKYEQIVKKINEKLSEEKNYYLDDPSRLVDTVLELREGQESLRQELRDKEQSFTAMQKELNKELEVMQKTIDKLRDENLKAEDKLKIQSDKISTLEVQVIEAQKKLDDMQIPSVNDEELKQLREKNIELQNSWGYQLQIKVEALKLIWLKTK